MNTAIHKTLKISPRPIEFWFEFASTYSYLSIMRIEDAAAAQGIELVWRPFLLGPVFQRFGWTTSPFLMQAQKGQYMWRDVARRAEKFGLPFKQPSRFPQGSTLPMRVAMLAANESWMSTYCRRVTMQNFVEDADISDAANVLRALEGLVPNPAAYLANATNAANKPLLRAQTEEAQRRGIFGAPSFTVGGELFWGDDRLEDALDYCMRQGASDV